ncbi:MerR family transcriptional regulator [Paenibacillus sp. N1-5-1-14]|uniref:MerR family transcriptional regulator n=1 Tax=Paenibacillus radicibacter TaxID=2972488 RepID=UPI002159791A|nr:MerR family transcriptional regulator [Paenibacillus radicibacter]MCR8643434.1 MerR family transcriptional regulator [Paenibacillus radicibacter]
MGDILSKIAISRRTLHYYDQIDLLKPTISKDNGYRYYDDNALIKLQTILSLKSMDYTLDQIKHFFESNLVSNTEEEEDPWIPLLHAQIDHAAMKIEELRRKQFITRSVLHTIQLSGKRTEDNVQQLIKNLDSPYFSDGVIPASFPSDYFNEREVEILKQLPLLGSDDPRIEEALILLKKTRALMNVPSDGSVEREIVSRWRACLADWFKGDIDLQEKYFTFIDSISGNQPAIFGLDEELNRFIDDLMKKYKLEGSGAQ